MFPERDATSSAVRRALQQSLISPCFELRMINSFPAVNEGCFTTNARKGHGEGQDFSKYREIETWDALSILNGQIVE
jgi:hypothetical protein